VFVCEETFDKSALLPTTVVFFAVCCLRAMKKVTGGFFVAIADLARGMVGQLISSCWRADRCAKDWMSKNKSKNKNKTKTKKQHHPKTRKGHPVI